MDRRDMEPDRGVQHRELRLHQLRRYEASATIPAVVAERVQKMAPDGADWNDVLTGKAEGAAA
jgi:hypothetical protein